jgi:hypothetical protein
MESHLSVFSEVHDKHRYEKENLNTETSKHDGKPSAVSGSFAGKEHLWAN